MGNTQFSFDLGTNSIGWAVFGLDEHGNPYRLIDSGVRIFSDGREPKSGTSLAEGRRVARGMARRRDRYKRRRKAVLRTLAEYGLMPDDPKARRDLIGETRDNKAGQVPTDVYALRAQALEEKLPLYHLGRALFHLNQRRGFKSNRKTDKRENDQGKINTAIADLQDRLKGRTLGQYLYEQRGGDPANRGWVRVRNVQKTEGEKLIEAYGFYPQRAMLEDEFNRIWEAQADHYPEVLTEERRDHLFRVMFYQRPLKPAKVGKCSIKTDEERLPKAHPLFQQFRLYKEVNELTVDDGLGRKAKGYKLNLEQRDHLITLLKGQKESNFSRLRKAIKLPAGHRFMKESEARTKLSGDEVAAALSHKSRFGQAWFDMDMDTQWRMIEKLRETQDPLVLNAWLEEKFGFGPNRRDAIAGAKLPEGYGRLGETALRTLLDELKDNVLSEAEARERAFGNATESSLGLDELPSYQEVLERRIPPGTGDSEDPYDVRMGRITNPTVHIALNQLKRVTNALLRKHGKPDQIALELARDLKLSDEQKKEVNRTIARNTREAERRGEELIDTFKVENNGYNRALLKFWEELGDQPINRICIYCGEAIGMTTLFSGAVDIDHILPWSKTLDDSQANRILCHVHCNRQKRNRAPFEVPEWQGRYEEIVERANRLKPNKRWRFARDAMERFEGENDFLARQLTDTQYLSRMAHEYLASLYPDEEPDEWGVFQRRNHVRVVPGRLTEMLRRAWGLNSIISDHNRKNRDDHRHHAIDAIVVGVTTRSMLNQISHEAARGEEMGEEDVIRRFPPPWPDFRDHAKAVVDRIVVSHKPDHGTLPTPDKPGSTAGQLHNETAYGFTGEEQKGVPVVVTRKRFVELTEQDIPSIADPVLRDELYGEIRGLSGKALTEALMRFAQNSKTFKGIRRVRVHQTLNVIPIRDETGRPYKAYKGDANYRYDVWELPNGKWAEEIVSMFEAHKPDWQSTVRRENPTARKVLSLKQNDLVAYEHPEDGYTVARVVKFSKGMVAFAAHREGGALKSRDADKDDPFKYFYKSAGAMRDVKLRQIRVDEIGQVFDPGPQDRESRKARKQADG